MFVRTRLPLFTRSLWQLMQYLSRSAREGASLAAGADARADCRDPAAACDPAAYAVMNGRCPAAADASPTRPSVISNLDMPSPRNGERRIIPGRRPGWTHFALLSRSSTARFGL